MENNQEQEFQKKKDNLDKKYQSKTQKITKQYEKELEELNQYYKSNNLSSDYTTSISKFANPKKREMLNLPNYSKGEELFNAISHIVGGAFGLIGGIIGCYYGYTNFGIAGLFCMMFYAFSMIFLYSMSAIYHFLFVNRAKKVMRVMDHCTIYVLIMGTYTPVCVLNLINIYPVNYIILGIIFALGILGIVFNATMLDNKIVKIFSYLLYLIMGWLIICFYPSLYQAIPLNGIILLIAGGASYTIGAILYGIGKKHAYFHSIFHMFVLLGSILQFLSILLSCIL